MGDRLSDGCNEDQFVISTKVQLSGLLYKRPFTYKSSKWSKRFFVIKESFLLYYAENERKRYERKGYFSIYPKGVIPLGGCTIDPVTDQSQRFAIHVRSDEFINGMVALAAESETDRQRWIQALLDAGKITWQNAQFGETLIKDLETQGIQLCKEKQTYIDRLQEETVALRDEIDRNQSLEKLNQELAKERHKLQKMINDLKREQDSVKKEYDETVEALDIVGDDKVQLTDTVKFYESKLQELSEERERTLRALKSRESDNNKSSSMKKQLKEALDLIETETEVIMAEKSAVEDEVFDNEIRTRMLQEEKDMISKQASQLQQTLGDLLAQKSVTEQELKEEVAARLEAEKRLRQAEESIRHLEMVLGNNSINTAGKAGTPNGVHSPKNGIVDIRDQIMPDVKKLKRFFEEVAEEARIDANKPVMMKNAMVARKVQAQKTRQQQIYTSRVEKAKSLGIKVDSQSNTAVVGTLLRRTLSTTSRDRGNMTLPSRMHAGSNGRKALTSKTFQNGNATIATAGGNRRKRSEGDVIQVSTISEV